MSKSPKSWSKGGLNLAQRVRIEMEFGVPVDDLFGPVRHSWILALAKESLMPDEQSLRLLRDATEWLVRDRFDYGYAAVLLAQPLVAERDWNTATLYLDEDGWHARRSTWQEGLPYWPARDAQGQAPVADLLTVLENVIIRPANGTAGATTWAAHKQSRPDLYAVQR